MSNQALLEALDDFLAADDEAAAAPLRDFLTAFAASQLWVAEDGELAYFETKNKQYFLALFSDLEEAKAFAPTHQPRPMAAAAAIEKVARGEFSGLALNPAGRRFELTSEDIRDFFEIEP